MLTYLQWAFAGIWPLVSSYSIGVIAIGVCVFVAWFSPSLKKEAIWAGIAIGVGLACYSLGIAHEHKRMQARLAVSEKQAEDFGEQIRRRAQSDVDKLPAGKLSDDKYDRDNH